MNTIKKILTPLASLRITVVLLAASIILVFAGTLAQRTEGIWQVQHEYFYTWIAHIPFQNLLPFVKFNVPGSFPFAGGYLMTALLLVNLLAAHTVRFKLRWKRSGILMIHFGIILLLVGQLIAAGQVESQIFLANGQSTHWSQEGTGVHELAVVDTSPADHDNVVVVRDKLLERNVNRPIQNPKLPFDVTVLKYFPNSQKFGPFQKEGEALATAGHDAQVKIGGIPKITGTQMGEVPDQPSAFVRLSHAGKDLGTYLVSVLVDPQVVEVDGKKYEVSLRPERIYRPFTITLLKFSHDRYPGTDTPRNFSSLIRLDDPEHHVDREVLIRMNEPLRYRGETFYQQRFMMGDAGTILQVVRNPGWVMPYVACAIGGLGMVVHFGLMLINFLRKRLKAPTGMQDPIAARQGARSAADGKARKGKNGKSGTASDRDSYTLQPTRGWSGMSALAAAVAAALCILMVGVFAIPKPYKSTSGADLETWAHLPVLVDGRVMPVDSFARASLKIVRGHDTFIDNDGKEQPAIVWLADVLSGNERGRNEKVFRLDHPQIKGLLELTPENGPKDDKGEPKYKLSDKYFSANELFPTQASWKKLRDQAEQAFAVGDKDRDPYQRKVVELWRHVMLYSRLSRASDLAILYHDATALEEQLRPIAGSLSAAGSIDKLTPEQQDLIARFQLVFQEIDKATEYYAQPDGKKDDLFFGAPRAANEEWAPLALSMRAYRQTHQLPASVKSWLVMLDDLRQDKADAFNVELAGYAKSVDNAAAHAGVDAGKSDFEVFYNRFDPFYQAIILYVIAFILVCVSWLAWQRPLWSATFAVVGVAYVLHTFGILARMHISGRPPVTNLYSSAVFIGWGAVLLCVGLELVYRKGIGFAAAAAIAVVTLLIAGGLAVDDAFARNEGDTMAPLQAVLDTNLWLATHVVCVTLGYASTFLAGILGIGYVLGGLTTESLDSDARKELNRMIYAIVCFAMLFSFVGTILGGIWADQSWGRFWGWDSKENGAVLVVIWNALILHARWGGLVRERGVAVMAIFGNIVTAWSWFGTNMLGVGLHSYGWMAAAALWLGLFVLSQILIVGLGLLPLSAWKSYAASKPPPVPPRAKPVKAVPI